MILIILIIFIYILLIIAIDFYPKCSPVIPQDLNYFQALAAQLSQH